MPGLSFEQLYSISAGSASVQFAGLAVGLVLLAWLSGAVVYIPNKQLGVLEKLWSFRGSVRTGLIALQGEAGFQPEILRGGLHVLVPFQYRVHPLPLVTIPQGTLAYLFARDGEPLPATQTLAANHSASDFQEVRAFLTAGGQKGPQRKVLREGTYAINLAQFVVLSIDKRYGLLLDASEEALFDSMRELILQRDGFHPVVIKDAQDLIGIVTVHDGPALPTGEIIAPTLGTEANDEAAFHNNFQDPERFLSAGGYRGRQLQVLVDGSYYINRLFATVELIPKTTIEVGTVGVVVSYTGRFGADVSGAGYRHGELVEPGQRGVWNKPLLPGKYAFNTYAGKITVVPTTNFVLKWTRAATGPHLFDENLSEVALITKDAFEPVLPLSVVVHIDYLKAPLVVQRFGDIKRLVEQTLDPMVSAHFKNIGQNKTVIELLQDRSDIQRCAGDEMREKFAAYNLELQEVLIGTPRSATEDADGIEKILTQLRNRQIAVEQVDTYRLQEAAAIQERSLREKQAIAAQQVYITESSLSIQIRENEGKAALAQAQQSAEAKRVEAYANADKLKAEGQGEADRIRAIGQASADATERQVAAYGGPQYQLTSQVMARFAEAIEKGQVDIVPKIVMGGGDGRGNGNVLNTLLTMLLADKAGLADGMLQ